MQYVQKALRVIKSKLWPAPTHHWEYFGRVHFASELIRKSKLSNYTVLDLGGATGENLLKRFGVQNVTTLDIKPGADIVASAAEIPVPDGSYDFVTSLDMMEHVPKVIRTRVLAEMIRVSKKFVLIIAPVNSPENIWAENLVLRYRHDDFLVEHKEHGLVDFELLTQESERLKVDGIVKTYELHRLDNLLTWVSLMTEDFANASEIYQKCYEHLENKFVPRRLALLLEKH